MLSIPRFQAGVFIFLFLGVTYFGYQILDSAPTSQDTSPDEKPPTSKPWPWESRRQANQNYPNDAPQKNQDKFNIAIPFSHAFPDFYTSLGEKTIDELGQNWDNTLDETFAKYAPDPPDLQIEATPNLGQNWDN